MNSTATGGYLTNGGTRPNINHAVHDLIVGISGLGNTYVRPKNQPNPPPPPAFGTDWIAFGISNTIADGFAYVDINQKAMRQEHMEVTVSVYGSNADLNSRNLRDGLEIVQNWEAITATYGIKFNGSNNIMRVPELHNGRWLQRYDFTFRISQNATATYSILSFESNTPYAYNAVTTGIIKNS
ncbi:MAG TPA: hypothetical protein VFM18_22245 [Methanosarcina sp.]|nr:hypothetical protein [Methanosarcina sp.]